MFGKWLRRLRGEEPVREEWTQLPEAMQSGLDIIVQRFGEDAIEHAVIGGVAITLHGIQRTTKDLDFIVDNAKADRADAVLVEAGFERLNRGKVFGNYLMGPLRVDLLFTQGALSQGMLRRSVPVSIRRGATRLACPEDLIGLKLQALANNPARAQDEADIKMLFARFSESMDIDLLREYFELFDKGRELDELIEDQQDAS